MLTSVEPGEIYFCYGNRRMVNLYRLMAGLFDNPSEQYTKYRKNFNLRKKAPYTKRGLLWYSSIFFRRTLVPATGVSS